MPRTPTITPVTTFVDWNSQVHAAAPPKDADPYEVCHSTLKYVGRYIGRALNAVDPARRYDVTLRVYHGWLKGFEPTPRRKAMLQVFASADFPSLSKKPNVAIRPDLYFGDFLSSALPTRLHTKQNVHLPNTLRTSSRQEVEEKMIDSAIASEVVDLAHREPERWLAVVGDDDDLVPPVFVAEGARLATDGRVLLLRNRLDTPFLKLDDLRWPA